MFEILDCGCLRTSFKPYLAFLALGRLTYKMLASVTGSGDTLGGGGLLSSEATCNSHNNCLDQVYLIPGKTRTSTLAISCEEFTDWKRLMLGGLGAGGEGDNRG